MSNIPAFYRHFFTTIDPLMCLGGVFGNILAPASILASYTATPSLPPATETIVLLDGMAGFFAGMAFTQIFLLRAKKEDLTVWKAVQVSMVFVDIFMLFGLARALIGQRGGMDTTSWRGQDWGNIVGYPALILIRLAFLAGVGMGRKGKDKKA
ncbi:hypothetical protein C8J56DRAFT_952035 [Mycena floridula]|nr:hypothetical protein C8J56DRAFT_952035 [Mycena floridula]